MEWYILEYNRWGMNGTVFALDNYGGNLIAAGAFTNAGGVSVNNIAQWNGTSWSALGSGMNNSILECDCI